MTVLFDIVVELLARTAVWLAALAVLSAAAASVPWAVWGRPAVRWRAAAAGGVLGALALASLAHRFGLPDPGSLAVWHRPIYPVWAAGGALLGAAAAVALVLRRSGSAAAGQ